MAFYKVNLILDYFQARGWTLAREGEAFYYLKPRKTHKFPKNFALEIPKNDEHHSFDNYIDRLLIEIPSLVSDENTIEDFRILFSNSNSIIKYRLFDNENDEGKISFQKHIDSLDSFKKVLTQSVIFTMTEKQIFASAKFEVEEYLNRCKALQTEIGSYVSKFEVPNETIYSAISSLDSSKVNNRLFDVIEFVDKEIINTHEVKIVDENYLEDNKKFVNYELLHSIKDVYSRTQINNIEYQLCTNKSSKTITTKKVQARIKYFNSYLRDLKKILLHTVPLETSGKVKKLTSIAPLSSTRNEVILTAEIANKEENIKLILKSHEYQQAIQAHKDEKRIRIKGKAVQAKTMLVISDLEEFEIL